MCFYFVVPVEQGVVFGVFVVVYLCACDAVDLPLTVLHLDGGAHGATGGQHLVALQHVFAHLLRDLVGTLSKNAGMRYRFLSIKV